jgi:hypothetical protein
LGLCAVYSAFGYNDFTTIMLTESDAVSSALFPAPTNPPADGTVLCQRFTSLNDQSDGNNNDPYALQWYCAPDWWTPTDASREGPGGAWEFRTILKGNNQALRLFPPARKDFLAQDILQSHFD